MKAILSALAGAATFIGGNACAQQAPATPSVGPVAVPKIMMLRIYVADLARAQKFYHAVLGANLVQKMGDKVGILIFPGGSMPGIILIQSPEEATMNGSFVIQVPDLEATLAKAAANGGEVKTRRFTQDVERMPAESRHVIDPDGNDIEIMQIGGLKK